MPDVSEPFAPYRTDVLFLLIGSNPLPNYVAGRLLSRDGGALCLVHSSGPSGSGKVAQRLAAQFPQHKIHLISVDLHDPATIRRAIEKYLEDTPPQTIGLNYTGGNKMMAVHAYVAVAEFCRRRGRPVQFSYLDADGLELMVEEQLGQPAIRRKVALLVNLSLEKLFELHGIGYVGTLQKEPLLPDLAQALASQSHSETGIRAWQEARRILLAAEGRLWAEVQAELERVGVRLEVLEVLAAAFGLNSERPFAQQQAAAKAGFKSPRQFALWLNGAWLEDWTSECIKQLGYQERAHDINCRAPNQMQIDVAVLRGYQLFALSCGVTTNETEAKIKLLEIFTRGRQLGGDEARVALICLANDPEAIQQKLRLDWDAGDRIRVFGRQHLRELSKYLKDWFESVQG